MILFQCPHCDGEGKLKDLHEVIFDAELRIAKCKGCKKEFGVSFVIAPDPDYGVEIR